jgi:ankyrin repeat protein
MNEYLYQKIAENSDDITALRLLSSDFSLYNDYYFHSIFGKRYPDLIKYKKEGETLKHLYLKSLKNIGLLKEKYNYTYTSGDPSLQLSLLQKYQNTEMNYLLVAATEEGSIEMVEYALNHGADIHFRNDEALSWASRKGNFKIIKYLLDHGANINSNNDEALVWAGDGRHLEIVKYLIERGANIQAQNNYILKRFVSHGDVKTVEYLLERGANILSLHPSNYYKNPKMMEFLKHRGVNIHAEDEYALRWASTDGFIDSVKYLIANGANLHAKNDEALRRASKYGHREIVKYLIQNGADIHAKNDEALKAALKRNHIEIVNYLKNTR